MGGADPPIDSRYCSVTSFVDHAALHACVGRTPRQRPATFHPLGIANQAAPRSQRVNWALNAQEATVKNSGRTGGAHSQSTLDEASTAISSNKLETRLSDSPDTFCIAQTRLQAARRVRIVSSTRAPRCGCRCLYPLLRPIAEKPLKQCVHGHRINGDDPRAARLTGAGWRRLQVAKVAKGRRGRRGEREVDARCTRVRTYGAGGRGRPAWDGGLCARPFGRR